MSVNTSQNQVSIRGEFTRGTGTAAYAASRVISDGDPIELTQVIDSPGFYLLISEITIISNNPAGGLQPIIHIFSDVPGSSVDNARISTLESTYRTVNVATDEEGAPVDEVVTTPELVVSIDLHTENNSVANTTYTSGLVNKTIRPTFVTADKAKNHSLWALIETESGSTYTPIANENFKIRGWGYIL